MLNKTIFFIAIILLCITACCWGQSAEDILSNSGFTGGLIVHLGSGDGELTAQLGKDDSAVVCGLEPNEENVTASRKYISDLGLYGKVSIRQWNSSSLPYIDNLVNLIVAEDVGDVSMEEMMRVLAPKGVAYIKQNGKWTKTVKPRPSNIDDWTHYMHNPTNNAVANDTVVGSPRRLQWDGGPKWSRSHEVMNSMNAMVSADGILFYVMDEGPTSSIQLPPEWKLIARDAFNGIILWKRDIQQWNTHLWPLKAGPATIPRRLVAVDDKVYMTLGITAPVSQLDAKTGKTIKTYEGTEGTEEILCAEGVLYLKVNEDIKPNVFKPEHEHVWTESDRASNKIGIWNITDKQHIVAIDAKGGKQLWRKGTPVGRLTLTVDETNVYYHSGRELVCLDRKDAAVRWKSLEAESFQTLTTRALPTLVAYEDVLLVQVGAFRKGKQYAFDAKDGKKLWQSKAIDSGHRSPMDVLVVNDLLWGAGNKDQDFVGKDIRTGEIKVSISPPETIWWHPRCYRSKATSKYLLASRTGIEVVDVRKGKVDLNHWTRGSCLYGIMPANGMIYIGPHPCACLLETKTSGFNAMAPAAEKPLEVIEDSKRLTKGPAYRKTGSKKDTTDWPMYRGDITRSGATDMQIPSQLKPAWTISAGSAITPLVSSNSNVVTVADDYTIRVFNSSGKQAWQYIAAGPIDSAPTIHDNKLIFGCRDGYVYCLRLSDGQLVWKFLAATNKQQMVSYGKVESVWPVHGSVLVMNGNVYFTSGRSAFFDKGLRFYKLNANTGEMLAMTKIDDKIPDTGESIQTFQSGYAGHAMPVANTDILTSNGEKIFMRTQPFDLNGNRTRIAPNVKVEIQDLPDAHLFSPVGLLDSNWHHRSYWAYGVSGEYGWAAWFRAARYAPSGRIMSFDDDYVYSFARKPQFMAQAPTIEYQLYKADKKPDTGGAQRVKKTASKNKKINRQWDQTHWLSRGQYKPTDLTALNYHWINDKLKIQVRAMVLTKDNLIIAGIEDVLDEVQLWKNPDDKNLKQKTIEQANILKGKAGGKMYILSKENAAVLAEYKLSSPPIFDGLIAANKKLYLATINGKITCYK